MADTPVTVAIVVAAGSGRRFGSAAVPKQFLSLRGRPVLDWSIRRFVDHPSIARTVVVVGAEVSADPPAWLRAAEVEIVAGGAERSDSVRAGLEAAGDAAWVLVHDGARPLLTRALLDRVLRSDFDGAVVPGIPVTDTLKEVGESGIVISTPPRARLRAAQTPQRFPCGALRELHRRAAAEGIHTTDDAALFEHYGLPVIVVDGDPENLKVTTPLDLELAEVVLGRRERGSDPGQHENR